jgi:pyruvate formate lyase activating enzyme
MVEIVVDGESCFVPSRITVTKALEILGKTEHIHSEAMCHTGACFSCAIAINGKPGRSCVTEVIEGMDIVTDPSKVDNCPPERLVSFIQTPMQEDAISVFTHGCNLACDFCHNWQVTFSSTGYALTPDDVVFDLEPMVKSGKFSRLGISGGEPTLNRRWLVEFIDKFSSKYNTERKISIQVDTNATILTPDYIDELYEAGMTDISPDIKALDLDTYIKVSGIKDRKLAETYLENSWRAMEHIAKEYKGKLYYIAAIPYHPEFMSKEELGRIGKKLFDLDKDLHVNLVEYQPAFRARNLKGVPMEEIMEAKSILNEAGLERVWCQSSDIVPQAMDPLDLILSEEFED